MLWDNDLTKIRRENVDRIAYMNGKMWDQLSPVVQYLSSFSIPLFEQEVIKKDLIGFAEEADIEGITLKQKLGMPPKEFCDFLLQNREKSLIRWIGENLLEIVTNFLWWLVLFGIINIVMREHAIDGTDFWLILIFAIGSNLFGGSIFQYKGRMAFDKKKWRVQTALAVVVIVILAEVLLRYPVIIPLGENKWIVMGVIVLAALAILIFRNRYWNDQSKKYEWKS